uniref:Uncharacterized protein n=1 Tax=Rhizophora mucronata TaxID=61149 RepID=A0A2P2NU47_RHIMU
MHFFVFTCYKKNALSLSMKLLRLNVTVVSPYGDNN